MEIGLKRKRVAIHGHPLAVNEEELRAYMPIPFDSFFARFSARFSLSVF